MKTKIKWILMLLLPLVAFVGCSIDSLGISPYDFVSRPSDWDYDFDDPFGMYLSFDEIVAGDVICDQILYETSPWDNWQVPEETWSLRTGDCEDLALLFAYVAHKYYDYDYDMVFLKFENGVGHAVLADEDGLYYDPTHRWYGVTHEHYEQYVIQMSCSVVDQWDYLTAMWIAYSDK